MWDRNLGCWIWTIPDRLRLNPVIFYYLVDDATVLEKAPLENLAKDGQLMAYCHEGFWKCMDTQRDKNQLEAMWQSGKAPWKIWQETGGNQ